MREGVKEDVPAMERVYQRSWSGAYEPFLDSTSLEELAADRARSFDWQRGILAPDAHVLVADEDGAILGVAQANEVLDPPRDLPEVTMLYADPRYWGSGVATALLAAELSWLAERGHPLARLRVVEDHLRARRFYEREGWEPDRAMEPATTGLARLIYYRRRIA